MTRDEALDYIHEHSREYFQRDKSKKGYICPICGSGSGKTGTGITTKDGAHFTCWAGCFTNADIVDIIGKQYNLTGNDAFQRAYESFGVSVTSDANAPIYRASTQQQAPTHRQEKPEAAHAGPNAAAIAEYVRECAARVGDTDYFTRRGISPEAVRRFNLGYDPACKGMHAAIIPNDATYNARNTDPNATKDNRYRKPNGEGTAGLFNGAALDRGGVVFITEGEIDALSIMEAGAQAVGLASTSGANLLTRRIKERGTAATLILTLDADEHGERTASTLQADLSEMGVNCFTDSLSGEHKDPNEWLTADRRGFIDAVQTTAAEYTALIAAAEEEKVTEYLSTYSAGALINEMQAYVKSRANTPVISTGFNNLDEALDGGFYPGLCVLGGLSSLGKTSLALQIADNMAAAGTDVLIFSLEMSRYELMAKSVSRLTAEIKQSDKAYQNIYPLTTRGVLSGARYANYGPVLMGLLNAAYETYSRYAGRIFITEGTGNVGTKEIKQAIERHISITGRTPVVLIDYLQLIAPYDIKASDKQAVDRNILEMKRISRDYDLPLIAISSLNRENYGAKINMAAFKESGSIEFSADILLGLTLTAVEEATKDIKSLNIDELKAATPRKVAVKILKQRNGRAGQLCRFDYETAGNYFRETL